MAWNTYLFNTKTKAVPFVKASNKVKLQKLLNIAVIHTEVITISLISFFPNLLPETFTQQMLTRRNVHQMKGHG